MDGPPTRSTERHPRWCPRGRAQHRRSPAYRRRAPKPLYKAKSAEAGDRTRTGDPLFTRSERPAISAGQITMNAAISADLAESGDLCDCPGDHW